MIRTSYYSKYKGDQAVSISLTSPKWYSSPLATYPALYPPEKLLWGYKEQFISWDEYTVTYYREVLSKLDPGKVYRDLNHKVLLCWESPEKNCHRHLVAEWLHREISVNVREIIY